MRGAGATNPSFNFFRGAVQSARVDVRNYSVLTIWKENYGIKCGRHDWPWNYGIGYVCQSHSGVLDTAAELSKSSRANQIVIETSTLPIPVKEEARRLLAARGTILLDCTLSGTGAQARVKDLVVYASGDRKSYGRIARILDGFARAHYYVGAFGAGSKVKFVANLLVAIHNVAAAEAMVLAMKSGLDPAMALKVVADGAGGSRMLQVRGPMMVKGDYSEATMKVQTWQKDMTIIGDYARKIDCPTPLFSASAPFYTAAMAMGMGAEDTGAVCAVLEKMANNPRRRQ